MESRSQFYLRVVPISSPLSSQTFYGRGGELFPSKGHLDIYNLIGWSYKIINWKINLLYLILL